MSDSHFLNLDIVAFVECVDDLWKDVHVEQRRLQILAPLRRVLHLGCVFGFERGQGFDPEAGVLLADAQTKRQPFGQAETPQ